MKNYGLQLLLKMTKYFALGMLVQVLLFTLVLASESNAQKSQSVKEVFVEIGFENVKLKEVFSRIEAKTEFRFTIYENEEYLEQTFTLQRKKMSVEALLTQISRETGLVFQQINNNIGIKKGSSYELKKKQRVEIIIQTRTITGKVTSMEDNEGLPGVNVVEKGTTNGTVTDVQGNYSLEVSDGATLVFSSVGYTTEEIEVGSRSTVDLVMAQDIQQLQELVVVGYGTKKKVNLTGAVDVATSERLENRPIANVGEGLQGVVPNLNITLRNGDPAEEPDFNIRGFESINGGSPLILVDNVPMDINSINPNDIESVTVLKDAAAAAVYGARAAFGVILVETKDAEKGKINITLNNQFSLAKPIFNMNPITDPHQFVLARNMAEQRTNGVDDYDQDYVEGTKRWVENPTEENAWAYVNGELRYYGYNRYQERIMTDFSPTQQHDITLSGSTDDASYYVSFGYFNKKGYLKPGNNEDFSRYNILMKGDFKVNDWLKLDQKIQFNSENSDRPHFYNWDVDVNSLARASPIMPVQFPDLDYYVTPGDREQYEQYIGMYFDEKNFFPYLLQGGREQYVTSDTWLTTGATLTPLKGLEVKTNFSYNVFQRNYQDVATKVEMIDTQITLDDPISYGFSGNDFIENESRDNNYYVFNLYGQYTMDQIDDHYFSVMAGYNQEYGRRRMIRARANELLTPQVQDITATIGDQQTWGSRSEVALRGAFYRVEYIFKDTYLFEANGRYDGTSRFPKNDRFGFFPSFSVGWRLSNENFMSWSNNFIDNMKIRASYGTLGNQLLGNNFYPYIATMNSGLSSFMMGDGRTPFVSPPGLVSPALSWETVQTRNIGLDFTMFNTKLDASLDVYTRDTKDMLMRVTYPSILGTRGPNQNAADLRTSGWELSMNWRDKIGQDWNYSIGLALADWTSEITRFINPDGLIGYGNNNIYYEGQQIGEIWGYETVGIFQTEDEVENAPDQSFIGPNWRPGDMRYADLDGNGVINTGSNTLDDPGDRKVIGNNTPRYSFGINTSLNYKNWTLTTFFQGIYQRDHWPHAGNWTWFFPFKSGHVEEYFLTETWSEDNRDAYFPAPHIATDTDQNYQVQSRFLQQAGYIRLKNITLNYRLPTPLLDKIGLTNASVYFTGMNLWEASKIRKPLDPESIAFDEFNYGDQVSPGAIQYPMQRIFTLGTRISF